MYHEISEDLLRVIEPVVTAHGLEIVDASVRQGPGRARVQIVVDTPEGDGRVGVTQCASLSREIGHGLDVEDLIPGSYTLEVCSPGVDRALGRRKDFQRVVGHEVAIRTRELMEGRRRFRGQLLRFGEDEAHLQVDTGTVRIPFAQIAEAKAFYPFEAKGAKR
jgi:ribosome maturation factor RimP